MGTATLYRLTEEPGRKVLGVVDTLDEAKHLAGPGVNWRSSEDSSWRGREWWASYSAPDRYRIEAIPTDVPEG